jgi:hypothetical protein
MKQVLRTSIKNLRDAKQKIQRTLSKFTQPLSKYAQNFPSSPLRCEVISWLYKAQASFHHPIELWASSRDDSSNCYQIQWSLPSHNQEVELLITEKVLSWVLFWGWRCHALQYWFYCLAWRNIRRTFGAWNA